MKRLITLSAVCISLIASAIYLQSDAKIKQHLTAKEWQSTTVVYMSLWDYKVSTVDKAYIHSNIKYLPNKTYLKTSTLTFASDELKTPVELNISETGNWDLSDHYLLVDSEQFQDITTKPVTQITPEQLDELKKLFKISSQQSRRIDIINDESLLLTNLGNGSTVLFAK